MYVQRQNKIHNGFCVFAAINKSFTNTQFGFLITQKGYLAVMQKVSLSEALFSGTRQKVLGLLYGQPERSFFLTELIQLANSGSGSVQREVERLTASGLVTVTQHGRQKSYQANREAPIYSELCSLITKTLGPAERLKQLFESTGETIKLAILYGSVAKRTDHANSDIDLLLVSDTLTLEDVFRMLAPAEKELARPINPTLYSEKEFKTRLQNNNPFLGKVLAGEYSLLKGTLNGQDAT